MTAGARQQAKSRKHDAGVTALASAVPDRNFRFYDNRQKYLMFVNTCAEKSAVANRIAKELAHVVPRAPALRLFDAGVGDGTVLMRVMRSIHQRFPTTPLYIVGKEVSIEDVRLTLEKMPDRLLEHPTTVLVLTNMHYREAPSLLPEADGQKGALNWQEVALTGSTSGDFEAQIAELQSTLNESWRMTVSATTGNPTYAQPSVLVVYRADHKLLLDAVLPRKGEGKADYDLVIASQPYRLRAPLEFKASRVIVPLAKSLAVGGRLLGVHSRGGDPGSEILEEIWPGENPFIHDRHQMLGAVREGLQTEIGDLELEPYSDSESLFRYAMHTLPSEVDASIGTSTLLAAWNAAIYVGQIEDARLEKVLADTRYLEVTTEVLRKHGGLWFWDESYAIFRRRGR
jgi:hypothetical protein